MQPQSHRDAEVKGVEEEKKKKKPRTRTRTRTRAVA